MSGRILCQKFEFCVRSLTAALAAVAHSSALATMHMLVSTPRSKRFARTPAQHRSMSINSSWRAVQIDVSFVKRAQIYKRMQTEDVDNIHRSIRSNISNFDVSVARTRRAVSVVR